MKMCPWSVFGAKSRPGRLQDALLRIYQYAQGRFKAEHVAPREPRKIEHLFIIMFVTIDWHFDFLKSLWKEVRSKYEQIEIRIESQ